MRIDVLASGSSGNCYVMWLSAGKKLLLDAGIRYQQVIAALGGLDDVVGVLVTHEHLDHAKSAAALLRLGVPTYMSRGTARQIGVEPFEGARYVQAGEMFKMDGASILPFKLEHDAAEPVGYLIRNDETGEVLCYATDTYYLRYKFSGVTHWLVECNYCDDMISNAPPKLQKRLEKSHMSLNRVLELVQAQDMSKSKAIVLCHLSNARSDEARMIREVAAASSVETLAADVGMIIER